MLQHGTPCHDMGPSCRDIGPSTTTTLQFFHILASFARVFFLICKTKIREGFRLYLNYIGVNLTLRAQ